jgi:hypothetical protein
MQRMFSATLLTIARHLELARRTLESISPETLKRGRQTLGSTLDDLMREVAEIPLRRPFILQIERLRSRVDDPAWSGADIAMLAGELLENLTLELTEYLFFAVPPTRKWMYLEPERWFGQQAVDRFSIQREVRDASQCFALAQWTAAVFHSMRILELGLREIATTLQVPLAPRIDTENWKNIIDQIESKIREMEALPRSPVKSQTLQVYSEAAVQFRYFKDAWRNHVMHSRSSYDEQEAQSILNHVRDFMRHVASGEKP